VKFPSPFRRRRPARPWHCTTCAGGQSSHWGEWGKTLTWTDPPATPKPDAPLRLTFTTSLPSQYPPPPLYPPPRPRCPVCGATLMAGQPAGQLCRLCAVVRAANATLAQKQAAKHERVLPVVEQQDLIPGTKYARLYLDTAGEPCFRGQGMPGKQYYTESEAVCAHSVYSHRAPDPECSCGFWVPVRKESKLAVWESKWVALEIEIAGTIMECARDGTPSYEPPWGYRAQWQRVLSVSLSPRCAQWQVRRPGFPSGDWNKVCDRPPLFLCGHQTSEAEGVQLYTACDVHVNPATALGHPVQFLREHLRTEVRPGTVRDDAVIPPKVQVSDFVAKWNVELSSVMSKLTPLQSLVLPSPGHVGKFLRLVTPQGVTYEFRSDGSRWEVQRITSPELEEFRRQYDQVQQQVRQGLISPEEARLMTVEVRLQGG
jgi:hypothetical protein